jgi:hypothetical protein
MQILGILEEHMWWNLLKPPETWAIELLTKEWVHQCNDLGWAATVIAHFHNADLFHLHDSETPVLSIVAACNCVVHLLGTRLTAGNLATCAKAFANVRCHQRSTEEEEAYTAGRDIDVSGQRGQGVWQAYQQMLELMDRARAISKLA